MVLSEPLSADEMEAVLLEDKCQHSTLCYDSSKMKISKITFSAARGRFVDSTQKNIDNLILANLNKNTK